MIAQNHSTIERPALSPAALADRTAPSYCTRPAHSSALDLAARLIEDPSCSYWLQKNLAVLLNNFDPVDAVEDAELLLSVVSARLEELNESAPRQAWHKEQAQFYAEKFASEGGAK